MVAKPGLRGQLCSQAGLFGQVFYAVLAYTLEICRHLAEPMQAGQLELPVSPLTSGWHVGVIEDERRNPLGRFLLVVGH